MPKLFAKLILASLTLSSTTFAASLEKAPPVWEWLGNKVVPIDMKTVDVSYNFDISTKTVKATATVEFTPLADGYPMFDLVPTPTVLMLDTEALTIDTLAEVSEPNNSTKFRVLKTALEANTPHTLYVEYMVPVKFATFTADTVRSGFFMSDLASSGREYFEQYGPANFEFDAVKYSFHVQVTGTSKEHVIFTNGELNALGNNKWKVNFADFYTASSLYFHIANKDYFKVNSFTYEGLAKKYPVTIYAQSQNLVDDGVRVAKKVLKELEGVYGPITHDRVVAFITPSGGGMEYCGGTITSIWAMEHEFTHFWFARGVMPANGNSGWVDEAIASWRDDGYPRANGAPNRSPVNMSNFSPYRRHTSQLAYTEGATLISEFDYMFQEQGGMRKSLRKLFTENKNTTITYQFFKKFLEDFSGRDLTAIFNRYVLGKSSDVDVDFGGFISLFPETLQQPRSSHPRPHTFEEIQMYR